MKKVLAAVVLITAFASLCWFVLSQNTRQPRTPESASLEEVRTRAVPIGERGSRIVFAVHDYKHRSGIWPDNLQELIPTYLSSEDCHGWHYECYLSGRWQLTNYFGYPQWAVRYERRNDKEGWGLTDGIETMDLVVRQPLPSPIHLPEVDLLRNFNLVMQRRIASEPSRMIHYQTQISWHYRRKYFAEARTACLRCVEKWPEHWWPTMMMAMLDARLDSFAKAEKRLAIFTEKAGDFAHSSLLVQLYYSEGHEEKALVALSEALHLPLRASN